MAKVLVLRTITFFFWGIVAVALFLPPRAVFADTDVDALKQQVEALTRTVGALAHRVQGLEQKLNGIEQGRSAAPQAAAPKAMPAPAAVTAAPSPAAPQARQVAPGELVPPPSKTAVQGNGTVGEQAARAVANYKPTPRESWAQLKEGMSEAQVTALLGVPTRKFQAGGQTVWYYFYRDVGSGSVFFYQDGHVASRQKPPFGGWHW